MNDRNVVSSILKIVQSEQIMLECILRNPMSPQLRDILNAQTAQFHNIETRAHCLASQRGWEIPDLSILGEYRVEQEAKRKLRFRKTDSKIASLLILANTRAMISHLQIFRTGTGDSSGILSQRLLDDLNVSIRQLQQFL